MMQSYENGENILLSRQIRQEIVEICNQIYRKEWDLVREYWKALDLRIAQIISKEAECYDFFMQAKESAEKKNYLRLLDLLVYEIDPYIAEQLYALDGDARRIMAGEAKKSNKEILEIYHRDILSGISEEKKESRIVYSYTGTENVSISIKEGKEQFRLFSSINPWSEASDYVNAMVRGRFEEICVLGFGGGHFVRELGQRFPHTEIKLFLPNKDIFKAVIDNIPVYDVLQNTNLKICMDPACLDFLLTVREKTDRDEKFVFFIDRQEFRACVCDTWLEERLVWEYTKGHLKSNIAKAVKQECVGREIEKYTKNVLLADEF